MCTCSDVFGAEQKSNFNYISQLQIKSYYTPPHLLTIKKNYNNSRNNKVQLIKLIPFSFTNAVVKWPGSTHDSFILANSSVPQLMETLSGPWILGDSGYPLKKWLLTPFNEPRGIKEENYNQAHCSTRNTVERAFGVLKCRFRFVHYFLYIRLN